MTFALSVVLILSLYWLVFVSSEQRWSCPRCQRTVVRSQSGWDLLCSVSTTAVVFRVLKPYVTGCCSTYMIFNRTVSQKKTHESTMHEHGPHLVFSVLWCVVYSSRYGKKLFLIFRLIIVKYETALLLEWMLAFVLLFLRFAFARLASLASWTNQTLLKFELYINGSVLLPGHTAFVAGDKPVISSFCFRYSKRTFMNYKMVSNVEIYTTTGVLYYLRRRVQD